MVQRVKQTLSSRSRNRAATSDRFMADGSATGGDGGRKQSVSLDRTAEKLRCRFKFCLLLTSHKKDLSFFYFSYCSRSRSRSRSTVRSQATCFCLLAADVLNLFSLFKHISTTLRTPTCRFLSEAFWDFFTVSLLLFCFQMRINFFFKWQRTNAAVSYAARIQMSKGHSPDGLFCFFYHILFLQINNFIKSKLTKISFSSF